MLPARSRDCLSAEFLVRHRQEAPIAECGHRGASSRGLSSRADTKSRSLRLVHPICREAVQRPERQHAQVRPGLPRRSAGTHREVLERVGGEGGAGRQALGNSTDDAAGGGDMVRQEQDPAPAVRARDQVRRRHTGPVDRSVELLGATMDRAGQGVHPGRPSGRGSIRGSSRAWVLEAGGQVRQRQAQQRVRAPCGEVRSGGRLLPRPRTAL
mmetsp:Transcript_10296/g.17994  ORF Transcript_10296/g.17994 Transcript_10296/m.17994 type:complete len:212 (+) Transcript_10296:923-1558(+)